jgi:hypothetical protein
MKFGKMEDFYFCSWNLNGVSALMQLAKSDLKGHGAKPIRRL